MTAADESLGLSNRRLLELRLGPPLTVRDVRMARRLAAEASTASVPFASRHQRLVRAFAPVTAQTGRQA